MSIENEFMSDWQPIATAPKDGTPVLAWKYPWVHPRVLCWLDGPGLGDPAWRRYEGPPQFFATPTHWTPLPSHPGAISS